MEIWSYVIIVAIMSALNWFTVDRQIKNSNEQSRKLLESQVEADRRERRREVGSEALILLRNEIASMAEKLETLVDYSMQAVRAGGTKGDINKSQREAGEKWDEYLSSGDFHRVLHMQWNFDLARQAHEIFRDYQSAVQEVIGLVPAVDGKSGLKIMNEVKERMQKNPKKVAELQMRIREELEKL
jgi:hypothetical protein